MWGILDRVCSELHWALLWQLLQRLYKFILCNVMLVLRLALQVLVLSNYFQVVIPSFKSHLYTFSQMCSAYLNPQITATLTEHRVFSKHGVGLSLSRRDGHGKGAVGGETEARRRNGREKGTTSGGMSYWEEGWRETENEKTWKKGKGWWRGEKGKAGWMECPLPASSLQVSNFFLIVFCINV